MMTNYKLLDLSMLWSLDLFYLLSCVKNNQNSIICKSRIEKVSNRDYCGCSAVCPPIDNAPTPKFLLRPEKNTRAGVRAYDMLNSPLSN